MPVIQKGPPLFTPDPDYKPVVGSITNHMPMNNDQYNFPDIEFYTWETRARVTILELLKPIIQDINIERGKLGELDVYLQQADSRISKLEFASGVTRRKKPQAFVDIDNHFAELK